MVQAAAEDLRPVGDVRSQTQREALRQPVVGVVEAAWLAGVVEPLGIEFDSDLLVELASAVTSDIPTPGSKRTTLPYRRE